MSPEQADMQDIELIRSYLDGNADAFDVLYGRYRQKLYGYLRNLLRGQDALADDLFQKTWLKAIDGLAKYEDQEKFSAWLFRIAYHLALDTFRSVKRKAEEKFDESLELVLAAPASSDADQPLQNRELANAISEAVSELPPEMRAVFLMRKEDIPFRKIAEIQKCSVNTCLARMQYALKKLRIKLSDWNNPGGG